MKKIIIEENPPLGMNTFAMTVGQKFRLEFLVAGVFVCEIFESIR
jgi:hypothetical protein